MVNIVTVLKTGGVYNEEDVYRVLECIHNNISVPYTFYCLTDLDSIMGIDTLRIRSGRDKWWPKLELFSYFYGYDPTLYIDLDTIIVGNIDHLIKTSNPTFIGLRGFYRDIFNSGLMYWHGDFSFITKNFFAVDKKEFNGKDKIDLHPLGNDQNFIHNQLIKHDMSYEIWQDLFPESVISYKVHVRNNVDKIDNIKNASIVCFHGKPRPREIGWQL